MKKKITNGFLRMMKKTYENSFEDELEILEMRVSSLSERDMNVPNISFVCAFVSFILYSAYTNNWNKFHIHLNGCKTIERNSVFVFVF